MTVDVKLEAVATVETAVGVSKEEVGTGRSHILGLT